VDPAGLDVVQRVPLEGKTESKTSIHVPHSQLSSGWIFILDHHYSLRRFIDLYYSIYQIISGVEGVTYT
jgi:hypothetical protein